jgi:hypothetical protein
MASTSSPASRALTAATRRLAYSTDIDFDALLVTL